MPESNQQFRYPILDRLRVAEKMFKLIEQLSRSANSCDHNLVHAYALQGMSHLQSAQEMLSSEVDASK
jgi:hypothetical protein